MRRQNVGAPSRCPRPSICPKPKQNRSIGLCVRALRATFDCTNRWKVSGAHKSAHTPSPQPDHKDYLNPDCNRCNYYLLHARAMRSSVCVRNRWALQADNAQICVRTLFILARIFRADAGCGKPQTMLGQLGPSNADVEWNMCVCVCVRYRFAIVINSANIIKSQLVQVGVGVWGVSVCTHSLTGAHFSQMQCTQSLNW